ncbi:enhancer of mRNA-decapping protein 4 homolog isoform X2 [Scaptodrosophila lebanonensis]|uniref:Enhancer of mRNA-decapping protein 4 homolog isoform X2 n=1 Tax=Drosophila lebanonensis TaxID=7225 RepID=A0A6J2UAQ1_DROLE|nr:enhancer of mRNA-decapping protein 4 homolog isoform X2 [Scaptodrosophila lebanonensis]
MLIALFALAQLQIFRKTPSSSSPVPTSRCGRETKHASTLAVEKTTTTTATTRSNMSSITEQDQASAVAGAANGKKSVLGQDVEIVAFKAHEKQCCRSFKTNRTKVYTCPSNHCRGSSKVKLKNIVDYKWERKYYYPGHLVAVHRDGKHLAYAINVNNKATGMEGMVRVCNLNASLRALIKGMSGEVLDLQFAHTDRERILAVIDVNSLFVYRVDLIDSILACNLVLKVEDPIADYVPRYDMVSWCPYVISGSSAGQEDEDENQLLIWSRNSQFQCFHVKMIVTENGCGKIQPDELDTGYLKIEEDSLITCAALSPDGTTVAAACADGVVRFYQIYLFDVRNHRCLHEWKPHDGKIVNSLFFLDNINKPVEDSYWQHVITTSDNNTEIKLWNCTLWKCLQTINIVPTVQQPEFIAGIDRSASYLVLSSLDSLSVFVMQINNNSICSSNDSTGSDSESSSSAEESTVRIENIAEFKLSSGILSFSIVDASMRRLKSTNESYYPFDEPDDYDDDTTATHALVVHMFVVQMKSLQECQIIYQPCVADKSERSLNSSNSNNTSNKSIKRSETPDDALLIHLKDIKQEPLSSPNSNNSSGTANTSNTATTTTTNVPLDALFAKVQQAVAVAIASEPSAVVQEPQVSNKSRSASPQYASGYPQLNLMTPDAFSSSSTSVIAAAASLTTTSNNPSGTEASAASENVNSQVLNTLRMLATVTGQGSDNPNLLNLMNNTLIEDQQKLKESLDARKKFIAIDRNPERNAAENIASGGSSPSREVQEIMATQEDDDILDAELQKIQEDDSSSSLDEDDDVKPNVSKWLQDAPAPKLVPVKKSAELQNAANIMSQAVHASGAQHKNNGNMPPTLGGGGSNNNSTVNMNSSSCSNNNNSGSNNDISNIELNSKLEQLMDLVKAQSQQINKMEHELNKLQMQQPQKNNAAAMQPKSINELAYKIEMQLSKLMEQYLKRYENEHKKKLTEFLAARENQNRELRETVIQVLNQYVMNHFTDIIGNVLNMELQRHLLPRVNAKMDQLQNQMQVEIVQKLSVFDKTVKENIAQVCKSKQFLDAFGKSVLIGVQASLQTAFIESMSSTLIPAYEKSSQNMFKQLHDAFSVGIKDFMVQFNAYLQHIPHSGENSEDLHNKLSIFRQQIETHLNKNRSALTDAMLETQREVKSLEILLARQVQETLRAELRKFYETQNIALRSQAATPAPTYDLRDSIKQLLLSGQINRAFHQALLANDLNLVEFTLRNTDPTQAFGPDGCRLEQKVLLSLIQQISADMSNHNELKQSYLSDALLAINMSDLITREHAPKVLSELYRNCQLFIKNCPKSTQCSNVRLLMKTIMTYRDQLK